MDRYGFMLFTCFALLGMNDVRGEGASHGALEEELSVYGRGVVVEPAFRMRGKDQQWDHEIRVALPATYDKEHKAYPVLWLMDGVEYFATAIDTLNSYPGPSYLPEMIIVSVDTPSDVSEAEHLARRTYEFTSTSTHELAFTGLGGELAQRMINLNGGATGVAPHGRGGAPAFLEFLVGELRATLAQKYRMSGSHTLFGHSGGGLFCTYTLLAKPQAFEKYLCLSPDLNQGNFELFRMEQTYAASHKDLPAAVYFAAGEGEILQGGMPSAFGTLSSTARMAEILGLRAYPSLKLYVHIFPDERHGSYIHEGLAHGLQALWGNCSGASAAAQCR